LAAAATLRAIPARAQGRIDAQPTSDDLTRFGNALKANGIARSWHAASEMPVESPLAFAEPQGPGGRGFPLIWLNLDHRELATPRQSHPDDEVPVLAATILGMLELGTLAGGAWDDAARQLKALPRARHATALLPLAQTLEHAGVMLATKVTDAEFADDAFPFEVVRLLTVGQAEGTIAVDVPPPHVPMPTGAPLVAYAGRSDARHPNARAIWTRRDASRRVPGFPEAYTVALILAAADAQPNGTVRRAYEEARTADQHAGPGVFAARTAFAEPYIARVLALAFETPTPTGAPK
jgi:hypothetical protein